MLSCAVTACHATIGIGEAPISVWTLIRGGRTWRASQLAISGGNTLSCVGSSCVTIGSAGNGAAEVRSTDDGADWMTTPLPVRSEVGYLSCATTSYCVAVGAYLGIFETESFVSNDGGLRWTPSARLGALPATLSSLTCPSRKECFLVDQNYVLRSSDGGNHWGVVFRDSRPEFGSIACSSVRDCVLISSARAAAYSTADGGAHWRRQLVSGQIGDFTSVTCPSVDKCLAVGDERGTRGALVALESSTSRS
jgi:hypothetical protein